MGRFWEAATEQAGREFGARHYRWFAGARIARRIAPGLIVMLGAAALVALVIEGYRRIDPNWSAIGGRAGDWGGAASSITLWVAGGLAAVGILAGLVLIVRRNSWRWSLYRPMWMRRY